MSFNTSSSSRQETALWPAWFGLAFVLGLSVIGLRLFEGGFVEDIPPMDVPIAQFSIFYLLLGLLSAFSLPYLIEKSQTLSSRSLVLFVLVIAVLLRLGLQGVPSILEDDYNRYLWDGAVTASGLNPYAYSPEQILQMREEGGVFDKLIKQSGGTFERINYPEFSTVYPPAAQVIFAVTHWLSPFSVDALRFVFLLLEMGCVALIMLILQALGRSPLWVALYAWNPLVIKEVTNSLHMEPILMLPVLAAVLFILKQRFIAGSAALAIAAGVKIWPALLILVIWRQLLDRPKQLVISGLVFTSILALMVAPIALTGLSETSGFVAFGGQWQASSAAYLVSEWFSYLATPYWVEDYVEIPLVSRLLLAVILLATIGFICLRKANDEKQMVWRMFAITATIYLLAPSHTPWYFIWILPFLCFYPSRGLLLAGALMPLHYTFFHFSVRGMPEVYQQGIVWLIWLPVWALLVFDLFRLKSQPTEKEVLP